jgi:hypothetical protein
MSKHLRLLILEDYEDDSLLLLHELKRGGYTIDFQRIDTALGLEQALDNCMWDAILSDYSMPQFTALEALEILQQKAIDLPFIVVSGTVGEDVAVQTMQAGAQDYIMKDNLRRLVPALERGIREAAVRRERKKAEEDLRSTLEELKRRNYELDNFVYKVSHDLRSPLCSIMGLVSLAESEDDIQTLKQYMSLIDNRIQKLDHFIQNILNHSKMLSSAPLITEINLSNIVQECLDELKFLPEADRVQVAIDTSGNTPVFNDELRVSIILKNIVSNAIKYINPDLEVNTIRVAVHSTPEQVSLVVEDNGIGIEEQHLKKIFNMFFRASSKSDGSGLGLYIVKQTIERIGGTITVESNFGQWTRFTITFPNLLNQQVMIA